VTKVTKQVKVLIKALDILSLFYQHNELSIKEVEELTGLNRTTIFRIMLSFIDYGYIEQDALTKRYRVSFKILKLAGGILQRADLIQVGKRHLIHLRELTKESTFLAVLEEFNIIVVNWEPSYYDALINIGIGKSVPAYCTGAGKAILAHLPEQELQQLLAEHPLEQFSPNTITESAALLDELKEAVRLGYAVSDEEFNSDIVVIGAPVFDFNGHVVAACATSVLKSRIEDEDTIAKIGEMTKKVAADISSELGGSIILGQ
jgi:IclR family KDG regulon transcriptional repressor